MGYIRHHGMLITSSTLGPAHTKALEIFPAAQVSPISPEIVNGYKSFAVFPDGSKEGWDRSTEGDDARARFIEWLDGERFSDGSGPYRWVEVQYGDDNDETKICAHSDEPSRHKPGRLT